jgi:hypothetical protein
MNEQKNKRKLRETGEGRHGQPGRDQMPIQFYPAASTKLAAAAQSNQRGWGVSSRVAAIVEAKLPSQFSLHAALAWLHSAAESPHHIPSNAASAPPHACHKTWMCFGCFCHLAHEWPTKPGCAWTSSSIYPSSSRLVACILMARHIYYCSL